MLISLAGNIGAGKSSLTALLHEHYGWKPLYEPLMDNPYILDFYSDMAQYAYRSQMYFLAKQCVALEQVPAGKAIAVQDRSIFEDAEIFTAMLREEGYVDERDYYTYATFYDGIKRVLPSPDIVLYLRADTDSLIRNIKSRGRDFEQTIGRPYIENLNTRYERWAEQFDICPLHILDVGNMEFLFDTQVREELLYTIKRLAHQ